MRSASYYKFCIHFLFKFDLHYIGSKLLTTFSLRVISLLSSFGTYISYDRHYILPVPS